ncbi:MAG: CotH kinase family protein [Akkermansiaceae bacterium]
MTKTLLIFPLMMGLAHGAATDHLVSYWDLESNTSDSAAAGNTTDNGSWVGTTNYSPGKFGQAIDLNGNSHVSVPSSGDITGSSNTISVSTWFRVNAFSTNWQALIAKGEGSNWRIARRSGGSEIAWAGGAGDIFGGNVDDGAWHHVMGVSEGGVETRIYLDGVPIEIGGNPVINDTGEPMFIGNNPGSPSRQWNGLIDDVGIFDIALNDFQAAAIFSLANNNDYNYALSEVNELFQLADCPAGTTVQVGSDSWSSIAANPADGRLFIQLKENGAGVVTSTGPEIISFTTPHTSVPSGTPITFTWDVDASATTLILSGVGNVTGTTSHTFNPGPTSTTDYTLSAVGPSGTNQRVVTVTVTDQPVIEAFSANPEVVAQGGSSTITWQTYNTTSVTLNGNPVSMTGTTSVTPSFTTSYTLAATNAAGTTSETISVSVITPGEPIISEFVASNDGGIVDEDGDSSDWIQISNATNMNTIINGDYFLTDDSGDLQKWAIPNQTILPGESVFYFASGKIGTSTPHANFSLSANGEYLALVKVSGGITTILSEFNEYPRQFSGVSYGVLPDLVTYQFHQSPTPTAENSGVTFEDFVRDTSFSIGRGFYTTTQSVVITSNTVGAEIHYTTDGSEPSTTNGTLYTVPISIGTTTTLRAIATKTNQIPTNIDTNTYIFTADVVNQPTNPSGWPSGSVNGQVMDYHMDPGSAVSSSTAGVISALESIPSFSIVTDQDNLTNSSTGIYANPGNRGRAWERPASVELIFPPGYVNPDGLTEGFQENFGVRVRGGASRSKNNPKHAFRLFFRDEYGSNKLNFPLFGTNGTDSYAGFDLRTAQNYSWSFKGSGSLTSNNDNSSKNTFMREVFARDTQRDMDEPHTRSRYVHLYLNGIYWGLFMTQERAEADFAASYLGGNDDDYDTIKSAGSSGGYGTEATDGNNVDWMAGYNLAIATSNESETINSSYFQIQGLDSSGNPSPAVPTYINVENLINFMMVVFYDGSFDAPLSTFIGASNNWFSVRNRVTDDQGIAFFAHDMEHSLGSYFTNRQDRTGPFWFGSTADQQGFNKSNPQYIHQYLANNREYRTKFGDIVHREFFNGGLLTNQAVLARFGERETTVDMAIDAEAARWGDSKTSPPLDRTDWALAVNQLKGWTTDRNLEVLAQLKIDDLYPSTDAPVFSQHGGEISSGFSLGMNNPNGSGTVYYTTDGSDPRNIGGGIGASATSGGSVTLNSSTLVQARVRINSSTWSALTSATFATAAPPVAGSLVITEINYHPSDPTAAEQTAGFISDSAFDFLEITNVSGVPVDLTGSTIANEVAFAFSTITDPNDRVLAVGESIIIVNNEEGFAERYPGIEAFGPWNGGLSNNTGTVELRDGSDVLLFSVTYDDNNGWPGAADSDGYSLILRDSATPNDPASWRISAGINGNPGTSDSEPFISGDLLTTVLRDGPGNYVKPVVTLQTFDDGTGPKEFLYLNLQRFLPVDNAVVDVQHASGLQGWLETDIELVSSSPLGDGTIVESYRLTIPTSSDQKHFLRVRLTATP